MSRRSRSSVQARSPQAAADGFRFVGARNPDSAPYRAAIRRELIGLAAAGRLVVPIGRTFPFADAPTAF